MHPSSSTIAVDAPRRDPLDLFGTHDVVPRFAPATTPEIGLALAAQRPVFTGASGGMDLQAPAWRLSEHLDAIEAVTRRKPEGDRLVVTAEALAVQVRTARPHGGEPLPGATAMVAPRQRPSICAVRRAVSRPRAREDSLAAIDLREANRVLERLQSPLGAARGHKFAVGIRRATDGALGAAAVCAAPMAASLHDGLTAELRRLAVGTEIVDGCARLLDGIADEAARMGYRRLVTYLRIGLTAQVLLAAGWSRLPACRTGGATAPHNGRGHDAGSAWTQVLRGEHRSR